MLKCYKQFEQLNTHLDIIITILDLEWGLNSKQLASPSFKVLEQTVVVEYVLGPTDACTAWGLKKEPVVGEGSACNIRKENESSFEKPFH